MRVDSKKLNIALANQCKSASELRDILSPATISRVRREERINTKTAGKIAKALNVAVEDLLFEEVTTNGSHNQNYHRNN